MVAFVTSDELSDFGVTVADVNVAGKLCDVASAMVRAEYPGIDDRIADGRPELVAVQWVIASMVKRALAVQGAPDGATGVTQTAGDFSQSFTFPGDSGLYIKRSERRLLSGRAASTGAFTFNPVNVESGTPLPYWDVQTRRGWFW